MGIVIENAQEIRPNLVRRTGGGWLALAPSASNLTLGVTAATEAKAVEAFRSALDRWVEILKEDAEST